MSIDIVARLEKLKANENVGSYYRLAKLLERSPSCIRTWRRNYSSPDQESLDRLEALEKELKV